MPISEGLVILLYICGIVKTAKLIDESLEKIAISQGFTTLLHICGVI